LSGARVVNVEDAKSNPLEGVTVTFYAPAWAIFAAGVAPAQEHFAFAPV